MGLHSPQKVLYIPKRTWPIQNSHWIIQYPAAEIMRVTLSELCHELNILILSDPQMYSINIQTQKFYQMINTIPDTSEGHLRTYWLDRNRIAWKDWKSQVSWLHQERYSTRLHMGTDIDNFRKSLENIFRESCESIIRTKKGGMRIIHIKCCVFSIVLDVLSVYILFYIWENSGHIWELKQYVSKPEGLWSP